MSTPIKKIPFLAYTRILTNSEAKRAPVALRNIRHKKFSLVIHTWDT